MSIEAKRKTALLTGQELKQSVTRMNFQNSKAQERFKKWEEGMHKRVKGRLRLLIDLQEAI